MNDGQHLIFDDPDDIKRCLNCKRPTCPGTCSKIRGHNVRRRRPGTWYRLNEFMALYDLGLSDEAIAERMGMSAGSIANRRRMLKLKENGGV